MKNLNLFTISIAGLPVTLDLSGCASCTQERIFEHYNAFRAPHQETLFTVRIQTESGSAFIPFHESSVWQIRTRESNGCVEFESHLEKGWINRRTGQAELTLRDNSDPENFLRVLYAWLCLEHEGLLLHSSGVVRNGKGYAFFGPSGSGKTTITRLAQDHTILSDDLVIIRKKNGRFYLYGVPFRGDLPEAPRTNASADLAGLFMLVKDTQHRVELVSISESIARLSACAPFVMAQFSNTSTVLSLCQDLARQVPVKALHFQKNDGFWRVIDELE